MEVREASAQYLPQKDSDFPVCYKQTELGVIPDDWNIVPLGLLGTFSKGQGIRKDEASSGDIPCVRYGEIYTRHNDIIRRFNSRISKEVACTSKKIKKGDLLFAGSGETKEEIGKCVAFVGDEDVYAGGDIVILSPRDANSEFLGYLLNVPIVARQKASKGQGDAVVHISAAALTSINIPLPHTKAEQEAIARALTDTDALIESLEQLIAKKRYIKQGTMQELLTGKRRLPGYEKKTGQKDTEVGRIPEEWDVLNLSDIGETVAGLTYTPSDVSDYGLLVLRASNVQDGRLAYKDNVFVDMDVPSRVITKEGDILICVRNGSRQLIGKCALIDDNAAGSAFGAFMSVFRSDNSGYAFYQFQSEIIQRQIRERLGATINQITNKDMSEFRIPAPSTKAEQEAIASTLFEMDAEITSLETQLAKTRQLKQGMMHELLTGRIRLVKPGGKEA